LRPAASIIDCGLRWTIPYHGDYSLTAAES
jgi:hypothetical protein